MTGSQEIRADGWQHDVAALRRQVADQQHEIQQLKQQAAEAASAERARIRQLATKHNAGYQQFEDWPLADGSKCVVGSYEPFADLLDAP